MCKRHCLLLQETDSCGYLAQASSLGEEGFDAYIEYLRQHVFADSQTPEGLHELLRAVKQRVQPNKGEQPSHEPDQGGLCGEHCPSSHAAQEACCGAGQATKHFKDGPLLRMLVHILYLENMARSCDSQSRRRSPIGRHP